MSESSQKNLRRIVKRYLMSFLNQMTFWDRFNFVYRKKINFERYWKKRGLQND